MAVGQQKEKKWTEGPTTNSNHHQYSQKQKEINVLEKQSYRVKGPLPPTSSCWLFFFLLFVSVTLSLISFATSAKLCAVRKVILEFLNCADIYWTPSLPRSPLTLPFVFALSPPPFIFLSLSLCQLSALAERHTGACRSASDRCSSSQAKRRKGARVKMERAWNKRRDAESNTKNEGKTYREEKWEE